MDLLVNIDVPDLAAAEDFYRRAFGLRAARRLGPKAVEMTGWPVRLYLLENAEGTIGAGDQPRRYARHWTPVHLDVVVKDVEAALLRAEQAGAVAETPIRTEALGRIVTVAEPFGNGLCLIQFLGRGYDEIACADRG